MSTPLAQTRGKLTFNFALLLSDKLSKKQLIENEEYYLAQEHYYQTQELNKFINCLDNKIWSQQPEKILSSTQSNLNISDGLMIVSVYPSFVTEGKFIVRMVNMTDSTIDLSKELINYDQVDALENAVNKSNKIRSYQIVSVIMDI